MSEMIERVSQAIKQKLCNMDEPSEPCALIATAEQAMQLARAVIAAMREPTGEMESAGWRNASDLTPKGAWYAMIDAALEE